MSVRIARVLSPVTVLGPGRRLGLWVQGCTLACPGCASVDTWDPNGGTPMASEALIELLLDAFAADPTLTGLSLSGGEPIQQGGELAVVMEQLKSVRPDVDILLFTGYSLDVARRRAPALLESVDLVISGPYRRESGFGGPLRGSANQELTAVSELGAERLVGADLTVSTLQVAASNGDMLLVGIPRPGDLDRFHDRLSDRGVEFEAVSWRS